MNNSTLAYSDLQWILYLSKLQVFPVKEYSHQGRRQWHLGEDVVEEGVDVLEVPIIGRPVTTEEVSEKWRNKGNTQKYISNEKTHKDMCTNNF